LFPARQACHAPLEAAWALGIGQAKGAHTDAGGQCAEAIEAGLSLGNVGADGTVRAHTGTRSGGLERTKGGDGAAYIMPVWAGRTASNYYTSSPLAKKLAAASLS